MRRNIRAALAAAGTVVASLTLASCGHHSKPVAAVRPLPQPVVQAPVASIPQARSSETVWSLRAGLNVAALSCRGPGRQPVAVPYAQLLTRHDALLATAYLQEQGRQNPETFDRQQTRLYNTFANQASAPHFCQAAIAVAQRAIGLDSSGLAAEAPRLLAQLQAALRHPPERLAVKSR